MARRLGSARRFDKGQALGDWDRFRPAPRPGRGRERNGIDTFSGIWRLQKRVYGFKTKNAIW